MNFELELAELELAERLKSLMKNFELDHLLTNRM